MCSIASAQTIEIRGRVTDDEGRALPGAVVMTQDKTVNALTNSTGDYRIKVKNGDVLVYSILGYKEYQEKVGNQTRIDVTMYEDMEQLEDAVVIGYGYVRRVDLTGSVASVKTEEMIKAPVRSFEEALAGRVAGVQVTSTEGEPGSAINIVIRGQNSLTQDNSPLYVIDGFPMDSFDASSLNPSDIESIDVLKDASSTAIYGARGANGVILVTTKSGKQGKTKSQNKPHPQPQFHRIAQAPVVWHGHPDHFLWGCLGCKSRLPWYGRPWQPTDFVRSVGNRHQGIPYGTPPH